MDVETDLVDWGILEPATAEVPVFTRRFRGALARAAARLQIEERGGARREGNPIANMIDEALTEFPLPPSAVLSEAHRILLVDIELRSLPPAVRSLLGV